MGLTIVRGLPGSGKTSFARALAKVREHEVVLIAADDYFSRAGSYRFNASELGRAHKACQQRTRDALAQGTDVIVHNTFTKVSEFNPYLTGADIEVYNLFDGGCTDEELFERGAHAVPLDTIQKMRARYCHAPISEIHVHSESGYAYWQYPTIGWLKVGEKESLDA